MVKQKRKTLEGTVVSNKMQKTVTVRVDRTFSHPKYNKVMTLGKKYYAHTDKELENGQRVVIEETRPISKLKRWRVTSLLS